MKLFSMVRFGGLVLCATSVAGAASAAEFTVRYTSAVAAVPLSPWMMLGLGVAIAGATALVLHKRGMGQALAVALAGTLGLSVLGVAQNAYAAPITGALLNLAGGGSQSVTLSEREVDVTVTNTTSGAVTITEMDMHSAYHKSNDRSTTCEVGLVLPASGTCLVALSEIM